MRRSLFALAAAAAFLPATAARAAEGDIIVQREPGLDSKEIRELRNDAGVKLVTELGIERVELVEPKNGDVAGALAELRADEDVIYAEPDRIMRVALTPNDYWWLDLWALSNPGDTDIDAPEAWDRSLGTGVAVAVADTGISSAHEDLVGQTTGNPDEVPGNGIDDDGNGKIDDSAGWDFVSDDSIPQDGHGHGTHVSGTIAAAGANSVGLIGVAPKAKVLPLRVLDNTGSGLASGIAAAFDYAGDLGVRIVNASLGGRKSDLIESAIAAHPNTLYVVAAGNDSQNADSYDEAFPCALKLDNVLCVGASDDSDVRASFSNYGPTNVDLFAPGVGILSSWWTSPLAYAELDGTSMAAPHVAGAAALALATRPGATAWDLKQALMISVDAKASLSGLAVTGGRLNADRAVTAVNGPLPTPTPEPTPQPPIATPTPPPAPPAPVVPVVTPTPTPTITPPTYLFDMKIRGSLRTKRSKLKVRFSLSQPATVRFAIAKRGSRRTLSAWTKKARAGANSVTIKRRLPTRKTLKPGVYSLSVGLNATATSSRSIRVR